MAKKDNSKKKNVRFTLDGLLHRVSRLNLKADVVIDGEIVKDYKVAWVEVRGGQDPVYISRSIKFSRDYQRSVEEASVEEDKEISDKILKDAGLKFTSLSVACAIEAWDEDFFGRPFDLDYAIEIFQKEEHFLIYNQIALHMQDSIDFLPLASQNQ